MFPSEPLAQSFYRQGVDRAVTIDQELAAPPQDTILGRALTCLSAAPTTGTARGSA